MTNWTHDDLTTLAQRTADGHRAAVIAAELGRTRAAVQIQQSRLRVVGLCVRVYPATCTLPDCGGRYYARALCVRHYAKWRRMKAAAIGRLLLVLP